MKINELGRFQHTPTLMLLSQHAHRNGICDNMDHRQLENQSLMCTHNYMYTYSTYLMFFLEVDTCIYMLSYFGLHTV